jgi:hypothetical protein
VDQTVGTELVKLLIQVVYADHVVTGTERMALLAAAARLGGEGAVAIVHAVLDGQQKPPPPNMGALRSHRSEVLREVARMGAVDGVNQDEIDLVGTIGELLR